MNTTTPYNPPPVVWSDHPTSGGAMPTLVLSCHQNTTFASVAEQAVEVSLEAWRQARLVLPQDHGRCPWTDGRAMATFEDLGDIPEHPAMGAVNKTVDAVLDLTELIERLDDKASGIQHWLGGLEMSRARTFRDPSGVSEFGEADAPEVHLAQVARFAAETEAEVSALEQLAKSIRNRFDVAVLKLSMHGLLGGE